MRLQKIKLSGFKSFVDPTTIEVNGSLVGIVGPNGCGKSNVIDAVRWVLGESSAKQLRGENMQDVIFNGSNKRKPVSRASVELVFDNYSKLLSSSFGVYDEVSIKRILTRAGDSSYYINSQLVRRKDITELFLGTGVGAKGYAVIEQGMISRIIDAKPEELRYYLEEAASVSKYREKRKETLAKLEDTKDNLLRVADINHELEKQIASLSEQAQDAKKYQELKLKLTTQQVVVGKLKMAQAKQVLQAVDAEFIKINANLDGNHTEIETIDVSLNQMIKLKQFKENELSELTEKVTLLKTEIARKEERKQYNHDLKIRLAQEKARFLDEIAMLDTLIAEANSQLSDISQDSEENLLEITQFELTIEDRMNDYHLVEGEYNRLNGVVNDWVNEIKDNQHKLELLKNKEAYKKEQLATLNNRLVKLEQEKADNLLDFNQLYETIKEQISELSIELSHLDEELAKSKELKHSAGTAIDKLSRDLNELREAIASCQSKLVTYTDLVEKSAINNNFAQYVNVEHGDGATNSLEPLWHSLVVLKGYELATEVVLGDFLNAVSVSTVKQLTKLPLQKAIFWLNENNPQLDTPIEGGVENPTLAEYSRLDQFVTVKGVEFTAIKTILSKYVVVDDIDIANQILPKIHHQLSIVTKDGHLLTKNYVIFNANIAQNQVLEYQNKILELDNELKILRIQEAKLLDTLEQEKSAFLKHERNLVRLTELHRANFAKKHGLELTLTKEEQIFSQNQIYQEKVAKEYRLLTQEIERFVGEMEELKLQIEDQVIEVEFLREKLNLAQNDQSGVEAKYKLAKSLVDELEQKLSSRNTEKVRLQQQQFSLKNLLEERLNQSQLLKGKVLNIENEDKTIVIEEDLELLNAIKDQLVVMDGAVEKQRRELVEVSHKIDESRKRLSDLGNNKEKLILQHSQLGLKKQEQELLISSLMQLLEDFVDIDIDRVDISEESRSIKELEANIKQVTEQINQLGLVNLKAIQDLEQATNKHWEILSRVEDLTNAIITLEDAIKKIDNETRVLLNDTYTKVKNAFAVYFKTLFGGGEANLELTDRDILNSGLQIFVQPPGKKNSTIQLLSGGEKALTAMSLVFAFFNLNPAPFCLLDEVDAPLDDANTSRFCNLVQELSAKTQFIYISHNRLTMEMADQLLGVTMQEKGVSSTVSVSLIDAVKHAV